MAWLFMAQKQEEKKQLPEKLKELNELYKNKTIEIETKSGEKIIGVYDGRYNISTASFYLTQGDKIKPIFLRDIKNIKLTEEQVSKSKEGVTQKIQNKVTGSYKDDIGKKELAGADVQVSDKEKQKIVDTYRSIENARKHSIEVLKNLKKGDKVRLTYLDNNNQQKIYQGYFDEYTLKYNGTLFLKKDKGDWILADGFKFNNIILLEKVDKFSYENLKVKAARGTTSDLIEGQLPLDATAALQISGIIGPQVSELMYETQGITNNRANWKITKNGKDVSKEFRHIFLWSLFSEAKRNDYINAANSAVEEGKVKNIDEYISKELDKIDADLAKMLKNTKPKNFGSYMEIILDYFGTNNIQQWNKFLYGIAITQNPSGEKSTIISTSNKLALAACALEGPINYEEFSPNDFFSNLALNYNQLISPTNNGNRDLKKKLVHDYSFGVLTQNNLKTLLDLDADFNFKRAINIYSTKIENLQIELKNKENELKKLEKIPDNINSKIEFYKKLAKESKSEKWIEFYNEVIDLLNESGGKIIDPSGKEREFKYGLNGIQEQIASIKESIINLNSQLNELKNEAKEYEEGLALYNANNSLSTQIKSSDDKGKYKGISYNVWNRDFSEFAYGVVKSQEVKIETKKEPEVITLPLTARATFEEVVVEGRVEELSKLNSPSVTIKIKESDYSKFFKENLGNKIGEYRYVMAFDLVGKKTGSVFKQDKFSNKKITEQDLPKILEQIISPQTQLSIVIMEKGKIKSEEAFSKLKVENGKLKLGEEKTYVKGARKSTSPKGIDLYIGNKIIDLSNAQISVFTGINNIDDEFKLNENQKNKVLENIYIYLNENVQSNIPYKIGQAKSKTENGVETILFTISMQGKDYTVQIEIPKESKEKLKETKKEEKGENLVTSPRISDRDHDKLDAELDEWNRTRGKDKEETKGEKTTGKEEKKEESSGLGGGQDKKGPSSGEDEKGDKKKKKTGFFDNLKDLEEI